MQKRLCVLGYFGYNTNQLDGQTVKTRDVYRLLSEHFLDAKIDYYDTQDFQYDKKSIFSMFGKVAKCNTLIYLPAHNNLRTIFPILFIMSHLFHFNIHYFVVGGWLSDFIKNLPLHRLMLSKIAGIHVETNLLKDNLMSKYNINNVDIFPNFRFMNFKSINEDKKIITNNVDNLNIKIDERFKICFISRVEQSKGLDTLAKISKLLDEEKLNDKIRLHVFGQKTDDYFDTYLSNDDNIIYCGVLHPQNVIPTLKQYDALIFPSHYEGEGCPGILVEALMAGVPVIASNWKYNGEFITDGINGFLCQVYEPRDYVVAIKKLLFNPELKRNMSINAYESSEYYSIGNARNLLSKMHV